MSTANPETLKIAQAAFQDFARGLASGDWTHFLEHLSEDFTFWFPAGPYKELNIGKDRAQAFLSSVSKVFSDGLSLSVERVLSDETTVIFEVRSEGLMLGRPYQNQAAISFDIRGDKICAYRKYLGAIFHLN